MIYYPQNTRVDNAATDFEVDHDGKRLRGWALNRDGRNPILYFGGNAERVENNRRDFGRLFPGRPVYLLAYRGYGASDGEASEHALLGDALAIYDAVHQRHPGQPVSVIGRSLGSGIASYVASQRSVSKLALVTPFDSLASVAQAHYTWLPVQWLIKDRYPSIDFLHDYKGDVMVISAGRDEVVLAQNTKRLIASLPKPPQVVGIETANHNSVSQDPAYGRALSKYMR